MDKSEKEFLKEKPCNDLIEIYKTHDNEEIRIAARNEVIIRQTSSVNKAAWNHHKWKNSCAIEDLVQEGWRGVLKAVDKFDSSYNVPFEAYAYNWADALIRYCIYSKGRTIKTPIPKIRDLAFLKKEIDSFKETHGREPSITEITEITGMNTKKVKKTLINDISISSTNQAPSPGNATKEISLVSSIVNPSQACEHNENISIMKKLIETQLDRLEQQVLISRHGLFGMKKKTLDEVSQEIDYTRPGVRAVECRAVQKLKLAYDRLEDGIIQI